MSVVAGVTPHPPPHAGRTGEGSRDNENAPAAKYARAICVAYGGSELSCQPSPIARLQEEGGAGWPLWHRNHNLLSSTAPATSSQKLPPKPHSKQLEG
jgi:hypothetical protein